MEAEQVLAPAPDLKGGGFEVPEGHRQKHAQSQVQVPRAKAQGRAKGVCRLACFASVHGNYRRDKLG
jgi:hypothetical protein